MRNSSFGVRLLEQKRKRERETKWTAWPLCMRARRMTPAALIHIARGFDCEAPLSLSNSHSLNSLTLHLSSTSDAVKYLINSLLGEGKGLVTMHNVINRCAGGKQVPFHYSGVSVAINCHLAPLKLPSVASTIVARAVPSFRLGLFFMTDGGCIAVVLFRSRAIFVVIPTRCFLPTPW